MPPTRPRAIDDSRSDASSIINGLKEKAALGAATGAGVSKSKKNNAATANGISKNATNGTNGDSSSVADLAPKTEWSSMPPSMLLTYRNAYRLPTATCYTQPHADIIYRSSRTALRSPSSVLARKRLRESKKQLPKAKKKNNIASTKDTDSTTDPTASLNNATTITKAPTAAVATATVASPAPSIASLALPTTTHPLLPRDQIERQSPQSLATAVRKHFNAQQLNEAETVARFIYVARHSSSRGAVCTEGSTGNGEGFWMGSQGREIRAGEGGEVGFRLRFRP